MKNPQLIGILVVLILIGFFQRGKRESMIEKEGFRSSDNRMREKFCPRGYCQEDQVKEMGLLEKTPKKYPCYQKYKKMGYDNPYIYPYSYNWNQNHPIDKYKYPQWVRQMQKDLSEDQFPGYTYY